MQADAAEYEFPEWESGGLSVQSLRAGGDGPDAQESWSSRLRGSLRDVVVVMLWPEYADMVGGMRGMRAYRQTRRHHI